jgi:hypothetical protein
MNFREHKQDLNGSLKFSAPTYQNPDGPDLISNIRRSGGPRRA